jgi:RHH-type transcriptional regulator, rel operon repressor / antitoxin RelB
MDKGNLGVMGDSTTITVRVPKSVRDRLEKLAEETKRSRSSLAAEGISAFVDLEERQIEEIKQALKSIDRGLGVTHDDVEDWVASWDTKNERPMPKAV